VRAILFGAGASFGCGDVDPCPPPLGAGLFPSLRRIYPTWRSVPDEAAALFEQHFESGMAEIIEKYGYSVGPLMQEMARFFSIFRVPEGAMNLYVELIDSLKGREDILWGTLNYECILEQAAANRGHSISYFSDPGPDTFGFPVWKLHGSCNFKVSGLEATGGVRYSGTGVTFAGSIEPIDPGEVQAYYSGNTALYPAMALYAADKPISMSPGPIKEAQARWNDHILDCERVIVIGVRPYPEDRHIWKSLAETSAELAAVGNQEAFESWAADSRPDKVVQILGSRWSDATDQVIEFLVS